MRIVIVTSDATVWMLRACLFLLERHWPEHPPVVVGGYTPPPWPLPEYVTWHTIGDFSDYPVQRWSDGVRKFLYALPDNVICWTMDDFWLVRAVDDAGVRLAYAHMLANPHLARFDLTTDRLYAQGARREGTLGHLHLVVTPPETPYQLSFQAGLWRRAALVQYLVDGETPWESEIRGSHRMTLAAANVVGTVEAPLRYLIARQQGRMTLDGGYQVPAPVVPAEDLAELERLGYLAEPQAVVE